MVFELIFLAIVQGITEFLPISSSGHLNFLSYFLPLNKEHLLLYFLVLHAGTACAAIYFFRSDIFSILKGVADILTKQKTEEAQNALKWILLVVVVSIPTGIIGISLKSTIENLGNNLLFMGIAWIGTAGVLFATKYSISKNLEIQTFGYKEAFLVGVAQSIALIPGVSRSGSTIAMALFLGATPIFAGKLSFLASFVAIFGALFLEILEYMKIENSDISMIYLLVGFIISFIVGLFSLKFLINLLTQGKLFLFSIYCVIIGVLSSIIYFIKL